MNQRALTQLVVHSWTTNPLWKPQVLVYIPDFSVPEHINLLYACSLCARKKKRDMGLLETGCFDVVTDKKDIMILESPLAVFLTSATFLLLAGTSSVQTSEQGQGGAGLWS